MSNRVWPMNATLPLNQTLPTAQNDPCCTPLVREPLTEDWASDLARMFKALGDPVRLRLLSRVASHPGGEACVCDLSAGGRPKARRMLTQTTETQDQLTEIFDLTKWAPRS